MPRRIQGNPCTCWDFHVFSLKATSYTTGLDELVRCLEKGKTNRRRPHEPGSGDQWPWVSSLLNRDYLVDPLFGERGHAPS